MDVIVGAGLAGLTAARRLVEAGREVVVVDKGRSVGGRLATRRVEAPGVGEARLDHGAQFFTVRGDALAHLTRELLHIGLVRVWTQGFGDHDGHPRHVVAGGMNALAKHLADGLDVRLATHVTAVGARPSGWRIVADGLDLAADAVVLTPPVPQALALLAAGDVALDPATADELAAIDYDRALAVLAVLDGPPELPDPGAVQLDDGPFTFVADNAAKGISGPHAVTLHTTDAVARARWDDDDAAVLTGLLADAAPWLGTARVVTAQLKRWRYASPRRTWPEPCCVVPGRPAPLVLAGDAFDGPRVEGAFESGRAAAAAVLAAPR